MSDGNELRGFVARLVGWTSDRTIELALHSIELAERHRAALVLVADGDAVPIARALHRRTLDAERPFIVVILDEVMPRHRFVHLRIARAVSPPSRQRLVARCACVRGGCRETSIYPRGDRLWMRIKEHGKWRSRPTKYRVGSERDAERYAARAQERIDRRSAEVPASSGPLTVAQYATGTRIEKRKELDLDWRNDLGRLKHHVLPTLGKLPLSEVSAPHIVALVHKLRTSPTKATKAPLAQRSVYNVYSVVSAMFRDAELAGLIDRAPAKLTAYQLGPLVDSDPEWRDGSVFTREEAEVLISHPGIPLDRRMVYALGVLAGLRPGEAAALRWRHYDATTAPLGKLTVALAYNTRKHRAKTTKTDAVRHVPVHPTLAGMLAEWRLMGWAAMMGRRPESDDLIVPLPPDAIARRRRRTGDGFRGHDYSGKKWREHDLPLLGWRYREPYATKSTFITLVIEDGAKPDVIRDRVTHTKAARDAFSGYDRGPHWVEACGEVSKLRLTRRLAASFATAGQLLELSDENRGGGGSRRIGNDRPGPPDPSILVGGPAEPTDASERSRTIDVASLATSLASAVLDGNRERATTIARAILEHGPVRR